MSLPVFELVSWIHWYFSSTVRAVRHHHRVGHVGRQDDWERLHDAIEMSLIDPRHQKRSHTRTSSTKRVVQLETLEAMVLRLLPCHIQHRVDELCTLNVVSLRSVVARASLPKHKVVWSEWLSERFCVEAVHGSRPEVHENRAGYIVVASGLIAVHVNALQLEVRIAVVRARDDVHQWIHDRQTARCCWSCRFRATGTNLPECTEKSKHGRREPVTQSDVTVRIQLVLATHTVLEHGLKVKQRQMPAAHTELELAL